METDLQKGNYFINRDQKNIVHCAVFNVDMSDIILKWKQIYKKEITLSTGTK
jgi:hypothetical protein